MNIWTYSSHLISSLSIHTITTQEDTHNHTTQEHNQYTIYTYTVIQAHTLHTLNALPFTYTILLHCLTCSYTPSMCLIHTYEHMNTYTYITMCNNIVHYIGISIIYIVLYIVPTTYTLTPLYSDQLFNTLIISLTHNTDHDKKDRTQCVQPSLFITLFN